MRRLIEYLRKWSQNTRYNHGVNPLIFGILYFGTIPPYAWSIWGVVKSYRADNITSMSCWMASVLGLFLCPYLYLIIWGRNLSKRFYVILAVLVTMLAGVAATKLISAVFRTS